MHKNAKIYQNLFFVILGIFIFFVLFYYIFSSKIKERFANLSFAAVPDLSSLGYKATGVGDAFSSNITDKNILQQAGLTNFYKPNVGLTTNDFVTSCASSCDMMNVSEYMCPNSNMNRNCDGFVLNYNGSNTVNPVGGCWLKTGPTGLNSSQDRIAYFWNGIK